MKAISQYSLVTLIAITGSSAASSLLAADGQILRSLLPALTAQQSEKDASAGGQAATQRSFPRIPRLFGGKKPVPEADPFRNLDAVESNLGSAERSNENARPAPGKSPSGSNGDMQSAGAHLLAARRALAEDKLAAAKAELKKAEQLPLEKSVNGDSPEKVAHTIRQYEDLLSRAREQRNTMAYRRSYADFLLDEARGFLSWEEFGEAQRLAADAHRLNIAFSPFETTPQELLKEIEDRRLSAQAEKKSDASVVPAQFEDETSESFNGLSNDEFDYQDTPELTGSSTEFGDALDDAPAVSTGARLLQAGDDALRQGDTAGALRYFRQAENYKSELDESMVEQLESHLRILSPSVPQPRIDAPEGSPLNTTADNQKLLRNQIESDVTRQQSIARGLLEKDPVKALEILNSTRKMVGDSSLDDASKQALQRRLDVSLRRTEAYIEEHRAEIELNGQNKEVLAEIDREKQARLEIDRKLAKLVDEYNGLMDQQRWAEAEVLAKRAKALDPENPVATQLVQQSSLIRRLQNSMVLQGEQTDGFLGAMESVHRAAVQPDPDIPISFPKAKEWSELTRSRRELERLQGRRRSPREAEIEKKLSTPVPVNFQDTPLSQVVDTLSKLAGVPLILDPLALQEMAVDSNTPISLSLDDEIQLKSVLNIILRQLQLGYVIRDDVLTITSQDEREGDLYPQTYEVADLVTPIPNFVPNGNMVIGNAMARAYADASVGWGGGYGGVSSPTQLASNDVGGNSSTIAAGVLAQVQGNGASVSPGVAPGDFRPSGPGGLRGGTQADFDSLIDLIVTTIAPDTWEEVGGPGSINEFETTLSLVISQTEEVHDQIRDLLEQLRRLNDLQITIEVRFITLTDDFFERLGVDFDFDVDDKISDAQIAEAIRNGGDNGPEVTVGLQGGPTGSDLTGSTLPNVLQNLTGQTTTDSMVGIPNFTTDLDLQFRQGSFGATAPIFGGFDPATAATFGFAILSDIEAFFFIQAAQGDNRTNVLQAPKVTLFNGQQATISDQTTTPFVISVIPVVGDFAAAHQPVILWLPEGTFLSVQAVASTDRRFVRMTVVPFFSQIGEVNTFTFEGSTTSTDTSSATTTDDDDNSTTRNNNNVVQMTQGTTVQLPSFSQVNVQTTVSVPDGGTILLGGVKRLREGRNERGVPILSKVPYLNRLFRNVGIGRETQSLMLMVTPRIIIQEEEEEKLLSSVPL